MSLLCIICTNPFRPGRFILRPVPKAATQPSSFARFGTAGLRTEILGALQDASSYPIQTAEPPAQRGVYAVYQVGVLVYLGKSDAGAGVRTRIFKARRDLLRTGFNLEKVTVKWLAFAEEDMWVAAGAEALLITTLKPKWNKEINPDYNGFGRNAPGAGRPGLKGTRRFVAPTPWAKAVKNGIIPTNPKNPEEVGPRQEVSA